MESHPFVIDEYVRWSDVDKAGIIFYGAYVRFFEIGETELFRSLGIPYGEVFDRFDVWLPRVHLECDFKYPARLDDRLRISVYFTHFGTSSIRINFDVLHLTAKKLCAMGHEVLVCTDRSESPQKRPLPPALCDLMRPFLIAQPEARYWLGQSFA